MGDGWVDPVRQIDAYPEQMFGQGMISTSQKMTIRNICDEAIEAIRKGDMVGAFEVWDKMLNGDIWPYHNLFHNFTGSNDYDNMLNTNAPASFNYYSAYVNLPSVRKMIHVGDAKFPSVRHPNLLIDLATSTHSTSRPCQLPSLLRIHACPRLVATNAEPYRV